MNPLVHTYASLDEVTSADLNAIQTAILQNTSVSGLLVSRPRLFCPDGAALAVGPVRGVVLGTAVLSTSVSTAITMAGMTANVWQYAYAYNNAGSLGFVLENNPPDPDLVFRAGSTTHRYLGAVLPTAATTCRAFSTEGGRCVYRRSVDGAAALQALTAGVATSFTTVDLANFIPPHARLVDIQARVVGGTNATNLELKTYDDANQSYLIPTIAGLLGIFPIEAGGPLSGDRKIRYRFLTAADGTAFLDVAGYTEAV